MGGQHVIDSHSDIPYFVLFGGGERAPFHPLEPLSKSGDRHKLVEESLQLGENGFDCPQLLTQVGWDIGSTGSASLDVSCLDVPDRHSAVIKHNSEVRNFIVQSNDLGRCVPPQMDNRPNPIKESKGSIYNAQTCRSNTQRVCHS